MAAGIVQLDGSYGEGGGQIIRTALALSMQTGRPLEVTHIRAGREKPGLQPQHLAAVQASAMLCDAQLVGAEIGSSVLRFTPRRRVKAGDYRYNIGTAGSTTLVAETVLVPLLLAGGQSTFTIEGGTHVPFAPPAEHLQEVLLPALRRAGAEAIATVGQAGYYPRGGGSLTLAIRGTLDLNGFMVADRGKLLSLTAYLVTSELPDHVAQRGAATVTETLRDFAVQVAPRPLPSIAPGAAVVLVAHCANGYAGFTALGERGKPMEQVATEACQAFRTWWTSGAATDKYLADQLVLPAALALGCSRWTTPVVTDHLRTVAWVVRQFLPVSVEFDQLANGMWQVETRCG